MTHEHDPQTDEPRRAHDAPRIRASDAERAATVEVLKDAVAQGLLEPDEGSERMATAFATRFRDELPAIMADLPPLTIPVLATPPGWRHIGSAVAVQLRHEAHATRVAGVRSQRLLVTVLVAVLVAVVLLGVLVTLGDLVDHGLFGAGRLDRGAFDGGAFEHGHGH
jgi:hypothetical protein